MIAAHPVTLVCTQGNYIVILCPFCNEQTVNDPRKPRKRFQCRRCQSCFPAVAPELAVGCTHCGVRLQVPRWIVGNDVRCPGCAGALRLRWEDDE